MLSPLLIISIFVAFVVHTAKQPNFIFILTDDQDISLNSMEALPNTMKYIAKQGITFQNAFISTPICCPSRTETISGRNYQNVINQAGNQCMHVSSQYNVFNNSYSMFQTFESNGYLTASFGKLTNDMAKFWCNSNPILTGFSRIHCPCKYYDFYATQYFDKYINGTTKLYKVPINETNYQTSYIGNASINWLKHRINDPSKPFLMWIGLHAPHYPATPAAWYANAFNHYKAPKTPNYNKSDANKHSFVATNPYITENASWWIDQLYRDRLRSLLSVDDLVNDIINLDLNNTYILFSSDHGYHLGQYDIPCSKQQPYDETIRIPMYLRGPNIAQNQVIMDIVGNIDIVPTFLSLANIEYDKEMYDGRSWTDLILNGNQDWRTTWLTQYESVGTYGFSHCSTWFPSSNGSVCPGIHESPPLYNSDGQEWFVDDVDTNNWRAIRIINDSYNIMYAEFLNNWDNKTFDKPYFYEYYDINTDPFQLTNTYHKLDTETQTVLHSMLMRYGNCTGSDCW